MKDPYAIWVSEIMLQQTQVVTVQRYFHRFLERFPSLDILAAAREQDVLRLWEGLGYYRRARQMHQAAQVIMGKHGGVFPRDPELVQHLPGIGRYTAGAILSFAYDDPMPILEANTTRLYARLLAYADDSVANRARKLFWHFASRLVRRSRQAGTLNQALIELGGEVCRPRRPVCANCPVRSLCQANQGGLVDVIPKKKEATLYEHLHEAAVAIRNRRGQILLRRCQEDERWAGLWDFPRFPIVHSSNGCDSGEIRDQVRRRTGLAIDDIRPLTTLKHCVTRYRITLECYQAHVLPRSRRSSRIGQSTWARPDEVETYALSVTGRKLAKLVLAS